MTSDKTKIVLLAAVIMLSGCKPLCQIKREPDQALRAERFDKCMEYSTKARSGRDYTTNDDEDFDEIIDSCENAAYYQSLKIIEDCKS